MHARERVLRRNGDLVPLTPKAFDILLVLVQNSGRVLTKHEMMRLVWPDTVVEESNLARQVSTLRKALSDRSGKNRYIETIPWRGYRFTASVRCAPDEPALIDSLAVLPFLNESADPAAEYLSDGITETLINRLSVVAGLKVMSRNSVFRYKSRTMNGNFPEANVVGRELDVRAVLTGRIRKIDGVHIVSVELIDSADNRQLWGAQYHRELSNIFSLQETISDEIIARLRLKLSSGYKRPTENPEACDLYLKGRFFLNKATFDGVHKALELFQQAIAKDPDYALAYSGLLDCHLGLNNPLEARKAAIKALELDPSLGEAHASLGFLTFLHDWDWRKAEVELRRGIELNPNYAQAHQWYALYLAKMGRHEEALDEARQAQKLDPVSLSMNLTAGLVLCFAREYGRAIKELQAVLEMDANFAPAHSTLGLAYAYRNMCDEAIAEFEKASALAGGSSEVQMYFKALVAYCCAFCGRTEQARACLDEIAKDPAVSPYVIGTIHAQLGEHGLALDWLERACSERNVQVVWMKVDPALDPLRSTRRFRNLLARVGLVGLVALSATILFGQTASGIKGVVAGDAKPQLVQEGFMFTEGPVGTADGGLYFSDIMGADKTYRLDAAGKISIFRSNTNGTNGLALMRDGSLIGAEGAGKRISKASAGGAVTTVTEGITGMGLMAPNDLIADAKGGVYFTDPGPRPIVAGRKAYVYYLAAGAREPRVLTDSITRPNGLSLTNDGKTLIVDDTVGDTVFAFDIEGDGSVKNKRPFAKLHDVQPKQESGADGMAIDSEDRIYVTTASGIQVFDRKGEYLGAIKVPRQPANCAFAGSGKRTLYITAREGLYKLSMMSQGPKRLGK